MTVITEQSGTAVPFPVPIILSQGMFEFRAIMEHFVLAANPFAFFHVRIPSETVVLWLLGMDSV
jgi:hypothetical protein